MTFQYTLRALEQEHVHIANTIDSQNGYFNSESVGHSYCTAGDIQGEVYAIKDSVSKKKIPHAMRVMDSSQRICRQKQTFGNAIQKGGRLLQEGNFNGKKYHINIATDVLKCNEIVKLGGVSTHILKCGTWQESSSLKGRLLFLIIPGSPGIIEFYDHFMEELYRWTECEIPVWGISHTGHGSIPQQKKSSPKLSYTDFAHSPYSLVGQIENKLEFIRNYIPSNVKIVFIGHSIGCYMILKLLDEIDSRRVFRCFQLFPAIERMAESPNGVIGTPLLRYVRWMAVWLAWGLSFLSPRLQYRLSVLYFSGNKKKQVTPGCIFNATLRLVNAECVSNVLSMGNEEMVAVKCLDEALIKRHLSKLSFYFGQHDAWCPKEYYYTMKRKFPHCDLRLCNRGYEHAFVIHASEEMAEIVWNWLKPDVHKITD